jgi:hypothetical protein
MSTIIEKKTIKMRKKMEKNTIEKMNIVYENYSKESFDLKSFKLPELKAFLKSTRLPISGTKPVLVERIEQHFSKTKSTSTIQKVFRGYVVREIIKLRGPGYKNKSICVNDSDFVTMDKLSDIPDTNFFSYTDSGNFTYGFDILSLMQTFKRNNMENPYNREKLDVETRRKINSFYKKTCLLYPELRIKTNENAHVCRHQRRTQQHTTLNTSVNYTTEQLNRYNFLLSNRTKPIVERIQNLFMEIDQLGNYTQVSWFVNLRIDQYIRLYRTLFEIWNHRSGLSRETKLKICPFHGPFERVFQTPIYYDDITLEQIQVGCTTVFETMIYSGVDEDHRKLGAFHALSALTIVSSGARQAMPWLYESVAF